MDCGKCGAKWETGKSLTACPFCGKSLAQKEKPRFYDNSRDALAAIMRMYGADVLLGKLNAHFSDFAPSVSKGDKRLVYAVYELGAAQVLKNNLTTPQADKERAIKIATRKLTEAHLTQDSAETIICEFAAALGWQVGKSEPPIQQLTIEQLWKDVGFLPNENQRRAILHTNGPLFLTAGPGSGKTRVLLWRTVNLIVFHGVSPDKIFLSTFTEKAALQLKEGLRSLLGIAGNYTNQIYDIAQMSLGTVHSICQKILVDKTFSVNRERRHAPVLLDELRQYFKVHKKKNWTRLYKSAGFAGAEDANIQINQYFGNLTHGQPRKSRHDAAISVIGLFNRFTEESINPLKRGTENRILQKLLDMYQAYLDMLSENPLQKYVDLSMLQKAAYEQIEAFPEASSIFEHVIIDEYQDTNTIQEKIFFALAKGHKNICVVGDDDQALYRFRGASVENLVEFEKRCQNAIGETPLRIDLDINYRSRKKIVDAYKSFIDKTDWRKEDGSGYYRIHDKNIQSDSNDTGISVVTTTPNTDEEAVYNEVVQLVYNLKQSGEITDYNQCAFLFPAMKNNLRVRGFIESFQKFNESMGFTGTDREIKIYAPRAGSFLETDEARAVWGVFMLIFDCPDDYMPDILHEDYGKWIKRGRNLANELLDEDENLKQFVNEKKEQLCLIKKDYDILLKKMEENGLSLTAPFPSEKIKFFAGLKELSPETRKNLAGSYLYQKMAKREKDGVPFSTEVILNRATSVNWNILDLFYQLTGFNYFREMFDKAEKRKNENPDEGPICNLALITDYLSKFMEEQSAVITASYLGDGMSINTFINTFFFSFTQALFRLGGREYENRDVPFPKGRIPFLTIHQSKGLEFPVVILGSPYKNRFSADLKEEIIRELIPEKKGEPLEKIPVFDEMRMFYVALSRAQNLLVMARFGRNYGCYYETPEFTEFFNENHFPAIPALKNQPVPSPKEKKNDLVKSYSYISDFIYYNKCPRQYMVTRKYDFVPGSSETMLLGTLIRQTIEDLHNFLLNGKKSGIIMTPQAIEEKIKEMCENNYSSLRLAGGHALPEDARRLAFNQVIAYYRKLRHIAEHVTETEVKLILPNEVTPNGNRFNIEGVVNIVQDRGGVGMYELKTHNAEVIRENTEFYGDQLNVYAHVWQNLRNNRLDKTAIISTALPEKVKNAMEFGNEEDQKLAFENWTPVFEIEYKEENVARTIEEFAHVVDNIEDKVFSAPDVERLRKKEPGTNIQFAGRVCRKCDARFSCSAYREYVISQSGASNQSDIWKYLEDTGNEASNEEKILANLKS